MVKNFYHSILYFMDLIKGDELSYPFCLSVRVQPLLELYKLMGESSASLSIKRNSDFELGSSESHCHLPPSMTMIFMNGY